MSGESQEEWRPVVGWEGHYEVSNLGRVRSAARLSRNARRPDDVRWIEAKVRRLDLDTAGYPSVLLFRGRKKKKPVHRLVVEAFYGPRAAGLQTNHIDGIKTNNQLSNLELCTASENSIHRCAVLGKTCGENHHNARLKERDIIAIRRAHAAGATAMSLSIEYGVRYSHMWDIVNMKCWKLVKSPEPQPPSSP